MASIRTNTRLVNKSLKTQLFTLEKQHFKWLLLSIVIPSFLVLLLSFVLVIKPEVNKDLYMYTILLVGTACISWWLWTMYVIYQILTYQKSAVILIEEIHNEVSSLKVNILQDKNLTS